MNTIKKNISLEPLITRFPVCFPSISGGVISYYDTTNTIRVNNAFYGCIPLGIDESLFGGSYSGFTTEMSERYSGVTLHCYELQKWLNGFRDYLNTLRSVECHGEYDTYREYYDAIYKGGLTDDEINDIDNTFLEHGGRKFYKWLIDNYFVTLDFIGEYDNVSNRFEYSEWVECVENIGSYFMTLPDAIEFCGKMSEWDRLYYNSDCSGFDTCCDCVDYKRFGGGKMLQFIREWINRIYGNINSNNEAISGKTEEELFNLIPKTYINFPMSEKFEDLGVYVNFSKEFESGMGYVSGNTCIYDGDVYILTSSASTNTVFDIEDGWLEYYDYMNHEDDYEYKANLSGRTVSNLELFKRDDILYDMIGNAMPGHYEASDDSKFMQPGEGTLLDFIYKPGKYMNIEKFKKPGLRQIYLCDFLDKIEFYYLDINGDVIENSVTVAFQGDDVNKKIEESYNGIFQEETELEAEFGYDYNYVYVSGDTVSIEPSTNMDAKGFLVEGYDYVKFLGLVLPRRSQGEYHVGYTFYSGSTIDMDGIFDSYSRFDEYDYESEKWVTKEYILKVPSGMTYFITETSRGQSDLGRDFYMYGIKVRDELPTFIEDELVLNAKFYTYRNAPVLFNKEDGIPMIQLLSENIYGSSVMCVDTCTIEPSECQYYISENESYPLKYYKVNMNSESMYSDEKMEYVDVSMCDIFFDTRKFQKKYVETPLLRMEELQPFSYVENPKKNIYIDRGYATALDRHLRMGEINNIDQLEKYGNGIFQTFPSVE